MRRPRYKDTNPAVYAKHEHDRKASLLFIRRRERRNVVLEKGRKRKVCVLRQLPGLDGISVECIVGESRSV